MSFTNLYLEREGHFETCKHNHFKHQREGQDSEMVELAGQILGKLEIMSDEKFAEIELEAAE